MAYQLISEAPRAAVTYKGSRALGEFGEKNNAGLSAIEICLQPGLSFRSSSCDKKKALCNRMLGAINLAKKAAALLEAKPQSSAVATMFRQVFGQAPGDLWGDRAALGAQ